MSNHPRRKQKKDSNQDEIVNDLLSFPGFSVVVGVDDIFVGYQKKSLWVEIKTPDCYSKKTGELLESAKTESQKKLDKSWTGARIYCCKSDDIFRWFGVVLK